MRRPMQPRGHIMLTTVIAAAVLTTVVVSAIAFTGLNHRASSAETRGAQLAACAESARRFVMGQLGPKASLVQWPDAGYALPDNAVAANQTRMGEHHYQDSFSDPINTVVIVKSEAFGASRKDARDLSNVLIGSSAFGQYYRVVVKCTDSLKRESEVEFVFRYGI